MGSVTQDKSDQTIVLYSNPAMPTTVVSMEELLNSPPITLTIGPDECQTTIQSVLFRGLSRPLHELLNSAQAISGDTTGIDLVLQHDDKDAFMQLLKSAYGIIVRGKGVSAPAKSAKEYTQNHSSLSKAACPTCKKKSMQLVYACLSCNPSLTNNDDDVVGLDSFFLIQFYQSIGMSVAQIPALTGTDAVAQISIDVQDPISTRPYPLLHFAQLYALGSKYEMMPVRIAALKSFFRRLKKVQMNFDNAEGASVTELIDALRFLTRSTFTRILPRDGNAAEPLYDSINDRIFQGNEPLTVYGDGNGNVRTVRGRANGKSCDTTIARACTQAQEPDLLKILMRYMLVRISDLLANEEFRETVAENGNLGLIVMDILQQGMNLSD